MPTATNKRTTKPALKPAARAASKTAKPLMITELESLADEMHDSLRKSCFCALKVGLRLIHLHNTTAESDEPGGFKAALVAIQGKEIVRSTAYRWINAAAAAVMKIQSVKSPDAILLPEPNSKAWNKLEADLEVSTRGISLRRLTLGSADSSSDEARLDKLITASEDGDKIAEEYLEKIAAGEMTLVQAIRAQAGAVATKDKTRKDPVYLDIDGTTGQPVGLFPKCLITLSRAFASWDQLDETARKAVKASWKAFIVSVPRDLR